MCVCLGGGGVFCLVYWLVGISVCCCFILLGGGRSGEDAKFQVLARCCGTGDVF